MKKSFFVAMMACLFSLNSCADDQLVTFAQFPAQFPQAIIVEWGKDDWGRKAELNNKLELKFNSSYQLIGVDD